MKKEFIFSQMNILILVNLKWKMYSSKRKITNNNWNEKIFDIISFEE